MNPIPDMHIAENVPVRPEGMGRGVMDSEARKALDKYAQDHWGDLSDTDNLAQTMFNAGSRRAIEAMVQFSDLLPQVRRIEDRVRCLSALLQTFAEPLP
jgi:hypothetical protein